VPDPCTKVGVLGVGQRNGISQTGPQLTRCHGNQIFECYHKSLAHIEWCTINSRLEATVGQLNATSRHISYFCGLSLACRGQMRPADYTLHIAVSVHQ